MAQYINKSTLVAEIEKLMEKYSKYPTCNSYEEGLKDGRLIGYKDALYKINSLEVKDVDLDCNSWIPFMPSLDLPKERVTIAYKTNDERGIRYVYGHFQFCNGKCSMFWKDGNELPVSIKNENIVCWMPVKEVKAMKGE